MENWRYKYSEQQEVSHTERVIQAFEALCKKEEQSAGRDFSRTRDLLAQAYPESFAATKNILEGKV